VQQYSIDNDSFANLLPAVTDQIDHDKVVMSIIASQPGSSRLIREATLAYDIGEMKKSATRVMVRLQSVMKAARKVFIITDAEGLENLQNKLDLAISACEVIQSIPDYHNVN
jgi:hypothetical protein